MGRFFDHERATIQPIGNGMYVLSRDIPWIVGADSNGWTVTIPQGFESDLGSIPWFLRWLFNPADEKAIRAYLLHDYLLTKVKAGEYAFTSQFAASQFYEAMVFDGVPLWSRKLQFFGVVLGIAKNEW